MFGDYTFPEIFDLMDKSFSLEYLYSTRNRNEEGVSALMDLLKVSCTPTTLGEKILEESDIFKQRFIAMLDDNSLLMRNSESFLYESHKCTVDCGVQSYKDCNKYQKISQPKKIIEIKWYHLFLREPELFTGIENFLHLFLKCVTKTHAEGVAESMGNILDMHCDKRRGLDITVLGAEAKIHWNGPPIHLTQSLGEAVLDVHFGGRNKWHFVTRQAKKDSAVTQKLKMNSGKLPFYN